MTKGSPKAVILISGGLDSTTTLAIAAAAGFELYAISFDYGQRHHQELEAAQKVCDFFDVKQHVTFPLDLRVFGGSALTADIDVPKDRSEHDLETGIPITYVPARNTVFLSLALAWAETLDASDLFIGVNAVDYSGYPDCRPEFIAAFEKVASLATKTGVEHSGTWKIHTPLISLTKAEIIQKGMDLGVDYGLTHSCYDPLPNGTPCRHCDSCQLRAKGFEDAGINDPALKST